MLLSQVEIDRLAYNEYRVLAGLLGLDTPEARELKALPKDQREIVSERRREMARHDRRDRGESDDLS